MVPELWRIGAGAMTREQHVQIAAAHGYDCCRILARPGDYSGEGRHWSYLSAVAAAHHGRAALQCERCEGSGSTPRPGSRYAGANILCPACGGVGWGTE